MIGGFYLFNAGDITMGAIIAIVMLAGRAMAPMGQFAFLVTRAKQATTTLDSLQNMMEASDERHLGRAQHRRPKCATAISTWPRSASAIPTPARDSLVDVDLKIAPGERIGIIGRVASGKSTLGRLLCGLYAPTDGVMNVDGTDSRQFHPHQLREAFRFVGQDAELFSGTVRDNLMLGAARADDQQLIDAVRALGRRHLPVARCGRLRPAGRRARVAAVGRAALAAGAGARAGDAVEDAVPRRADRRNGHPDRALFHRPSAAPRWRPTRR